MKTKTLLFIAAILSAVIFISPSCKKETTYITEATITGFDQRLCVCCGGLMIVLNGETNFRLIANTTDLGIAQNAIFPIYVKVDWIEDSSARCNKIVITQWERR